ncbi:chromate transporter [Anaerorhabdus sp.]|uniref:chromate transporter n=1 Tax=Anaerorhabdus sp. TaxID=1872524 RepID=UPI002FC5D5F1
MKIYWDLYSTWFKIGLFTFGGGYAMLPLIEKEVIEKHHWATEEEVLDYYAIGQCTPGIIAVNTATFIGYFQKGLLGAIVATLGVVSPSIVIITIIATILPTFQDFPVVQHALNGIGIGVCILMVTSIIKLWKGSIKDKFGVFIFCLSLCIAFIFRTATVWVIILAGVCGLIFSNLKKLEEDVE